MLPDVLVAASLSNFHNVRMVSFQPASNPGVTILVAGMQNGPIPTTLTLLAELPKFRPGMKVRFLGW